MPEREKRMIFQALQNEKNILPGYQAARTAFISCFAAGYAVHLYAFTNLIPNADGLSRVADPQQMTISGRWFLHYATMWNGYVQSPALIGFLSVLFMALTAALVVLTLKMNTPLLAGLTGILLIVFPPAAFTYLYMFTASAYFFSILLAAAAVWVTDRFCYGFIPGALLLACSLGTYQAYLAVACSLSLICVILQAMREERSVREILRTGLKHLALLVSGLILYFLILRIFLTVKGLTLIDYHGISGMGSRMRPGAVLSLLYPAFRRFFSYFLRPGGVCGYTTAFSALLNVCAAVFGLVFAGLRIKRMVKRGSGGAAALTALLILLVPAVFNLSAFMDDDKEIMRYALVFAYILVLALADLTAGSAGKRKPVTSREAGGKTVPAMKPAAARDINTVIQLEAAQKTAPAAEPGAGAGHDDKNWGKNGCTVLAAFFIGVFALLVLFFANVDNLAYTSAATAHRATEAFAVNLVGRVEALPGYQKGMEVVIIGPFPENVYHSGVQAFDLPDAPADSVMPLGKHVYYYLNDWLNVPWQEPSEETMLAVSGSEAFKAMPLYPDDGSVAILDGRVVVRLAEEYRPKQPFEIQYESRR